MNAISIRQPWASAIALGVKTVETRSWSTKYRGPLVIHASKQLTKEAAFFARTEVTLGRLPNKLALGAIVAVVNLIESRLMTQDWISSVPAIERLYGDWSPGRFGWILGDVRALPEPIGYRGRQGFFDIPNALIEIQETPCPKS